MTYVDDIESDLSRFHRLDLWSVSFSHAMRLAGRLPAYGGALAQAMSTAAAQPARTTAPVAESPVSVPFGDQPMDTGDTPPEVVERLKHDALVRQFQQLGVDVTGIREVSSDAMERLIRE